VARKGRLLDQPPATIAVLAVTTLAAGLLLGGTDALTRDRIAAQVKAERDRAARDALGLAATDTLKDQPFQDAQGQVDAIAGYQGETLKGYVYGATGNGYGGQMQVLVAVDGEGKIIKATVVTQKETPGLGTKTTLPDFLDQLKGRTLDPTLELKKLGGEIDAVTGATISSKAVLSAARSALEMDARRKKAQGSGGGG
jgi:electron transport complex protein RnfG